MDQTTIKCAECSEGLPCVHERPYNPETGYGILIPYGMMKQAAYCYKRLGRHHEPVAYTLKYTNGGKIVKAKRM